MSKGKYSPSLTREMIKNQYYSFNCFKKIPPPYRVGIDEYDSLNHFDDYDKEGYDRYGYSAFDEDGNFVGHGTGIDRWGYTEIDYLRMSDEEFNYVCCNQK